MIVPDRPGLSLSRQCRLLAISRSSFYYTPRGESPENLALMRRIDEMFLRSPFFGSRQMVRQLRRDGVRAGRHRVRRLMRLMGLEAIYQAPKTSAPHYDITGFERSRALALGAKPCSRQEIVAVFRVVRVPGGKVMRR